MNYAASTFSFTANTNVYAAMKFGPLTFFGTATSATGITLQTNNATSGNNYAITFPSALPGTITLLALDNAGNLTPLTSPADGTTLQWTGVGAAATLSVKTGWITNSYLSGSAGITGANIAAGTVASSNLSTGVSPNFTAAAVGATQIQLAATDNATVSVNTSGKLTVLTSGLTGLTNSNLSGSAGITGANIASSTVAHSNLAAANIVVSSSTGSGGSNTNASPITVATTSSITVGAGRYVLVTFGPDGNASNASQFGLLSSTNPTANQLVSGWFYIYRDSTIIATYNPQTYWGNGWVTPTFFTTPHFSIVDTGAGGGSHTYSVKAAIGASGSGTTLNIYYTYMILTAQELV